MVESEPKKLFVSLPVLFVSANTKSDQVMTKFVNSLLFLCAVHAFLVLHETNMFGWLSIIRRTTIGRDETSQTQKNKSRLPGINGQNYSTSSLLLF